MNIAEALAEEIERHRELLEMYRKIPAGTFGAMMINEEIKCAVYALANDDVAEIIRSYNALKENS